MQSEDFSWYVDNLKELYSKYGDCYIAIKNKTVLGAYRTPREALKETEKTEDEGSFIVQKCGRDESAYTVSIASACIRW